MMSKETRNIYLTNIPLQEAQKQYLSHFNVSERFTKTEKISVIEALDRVTKEAVFAKSPLPAIMPQQWTVLQLLQKKPMRRWKVIQ